MRTDSEIQANVLNQLLGDSRLDASEIAVSVVGGVVSLGGDVDSLVKRNTAARVAEGIDGVHAIVNQISVHLPTDKRRSDVDIAHDAVGALVADTVAPDKTIKIRVQDGWLALVGEAESQDQRIAAQNALENIAGVRGITNLVHLRNAAPSEHTTPFDG